MNCQRCNSERILKIDGKTADCCCQQFGGSEVCDYVTSGMGIGSGDYLRFSVCIECGQIQGEWPIPDDPEWALRDDEDEEF